MSSLGHLGKLPLEICKEIYALLFRDTELILIDRSTHRKPRRSRLSLKHFNGDDNPVALLKACRQLKEEAAPVLNDSNIFIFALDWFLKLFLERSPQMSQHLRCIKIEQNCVDKGLFLRTATPLIAARVLRQLKSAHDDFCFDSPESPKAQNRVNRDIASLVNNCLPLLRSLQAGIRETNVKTDILGLIEISLEPCANRDEHGHHLHDPSGWTYAAGFPDVPWTKEPQPRRLFRYGNQAGDNAYCACICADAEANNDKLNQRLRAEVAKQLGLLVD